MSTIVKVVTVKLRTTPETEQALFDTMQLFNKACNHLSGIAWEAKTFRAFDLHHAAYHQTRELFGLPAQLTIRAISVVADAYKKDQSVRRVFGERSAVVFDARCYRLKNLSSVLLTTTQGRKEFVMRHGGKQRAELDGAETGEADLLYRDGSYYLAITIKKSEPPPSDMSGGVLGVDLGIVELATDSEGNSYSGEQVKSVRRKLKEHRRALQKRGTNSAKKRLRKISRKQSRFVRDINHCISKRIVQTACDSLKAIALENLTNIRERTVDLGGNMHWLLGNWSFYQLRAYITYKAKQVGIDVVEVNPRNTSRTCSACGFCDKANRKSQSHFECLSCGFPANADYNASCNIARIGWETRAKQVFAPQTTASVSLMSSAVAA